MLDSLLLVDRRDDLFGSLDRVGSNLARCPIQDVLVVELVVVVASVDELCFILEKR